MKNYLTFVLLFLYSIAFAQNDKTSKSKRSQYTFNLAATPQLFLNGMDVENDGIAPEAIHAKNTGGYTVGAEIERKGKRGFISNIGFQYGARHHSLSMGYESLGFFLPEAAEKLNAFGPQIEYYSGTTSYLKLRLMAGYKFPFDILHRYHLITKLGLSTRADLNRKAQQGEYYRGVTISKNDTLYQKVIGQGNYRFGTTKSNQAYAIALEWYIGLNQNMNTKILKHVDVGIEITRAVTINGNSGIGKAELMSYRFSNNDKTYSYDRYIAKDFSIGLRLSAGFWYK